MLIKTLYIFDALQLRRMLYGVYGTSCPFVRLSGCIVARRYVLGENL